MPILEPLPPHPRLLAAPEDWERLRKQVSSDAPSRSLWAALRGRGDELLGLPPLRRVLAGRRLLMVSREALERIGVLSLVANVSGERQYAERAIVEMRAVAAFEDWNPKHFLDVSEMALAVSVGYDWLHHLLSDDDREVMEQALVEKALLPSLDEDAPDNWWIGAIENWAQVCHGGLSAAAIAIADREPVLAEQIVKRALARLPAAAAAYAPDGAYPEGPMYWAYGTSYHVVLAAALTRLTGDAQGLDAFAGFAESAEFLAQMTAPSGRFFNYADGNDRRRLLAPLWWMARRFERGDWLAHDIAHLERDLAEYRGEAGVQYGYYDMLAFALLWRSPTRNTTSSSPATSWTGRGAMPVSVRRSGNGRIYAAIKGGSAALSHAHMDVGSFVIESDGVRWAVDPGMQDYESLERAGVDLWNMAQDSQRWEVFRLSAEAHNILRFDNAPQLVAGNAQFTPDGTLDLTPVYADRAVFVRRRFTLVDDTTVSIEDEWRARPDTARVTWQWLTDADAKIEGRDVLLRRDGATLRLRTIDGAEASTEIDDVSAPARPYDAQNPGLRRIRIVVPAAAGRLRVVAEPG
jgi:hypothetical protein